MALVTPTELDERALEEGVDLSGYSDARLEELIMIAEAELLVQTGRKYTNEIVSDEKIRWTGRVILLKHYPLNPKTVTLTINNDTVTNYTINPLNGIIYLNGRYTKPYDYTATYTLIAPDDVSLAKSVCMDLTLQLVTDDDKEIRSYSDGDLSITYNEHSETDKRIQLLKRTGGVVGI